MGEKLVNVKADNVDDFLKNVDGAIGEGAGVMGNTTYMIKPQYKQTDGKITSVDFKLEVNITRAHWSGGKADDANKKAIKDAEDLNKKHELKHKAIAEKICAAEFAKAKKKLIGKDESEVQDAVDDISKEIDDEYVKLDKREGKTEVTTTSAGKFVVKQVGE